MTTLTTTSQHTAQFALEFAQVCFCAYSINFCPANWRLPLSIPTYNETPGSFYYLLNQYSLTSSTTSSNNNITTSPLYFVRSGYVNPGIIWRASIYGYYWSGRAYSSSGAYALDFGSSSVSPSNNYSRYLGYSVRCVAGWE